MISNITILIFGLAIASTLIGRKMWLLRTGRISVGSNDDANWANLSIESIKYYVIEFLRISIHKTVLFLLKIWILFSNFVKRSDKKVKNKLMNMIHKNSPYNKKTDQKPSNFLEDIKEHKEKMLSGIKQD